MKSRNCRCGNLRWCIKILYPFQTFPRALTTLWPLGDQVHQVLLICIKRMIFQTKDFLKRYPDGSCMTDSHLWLDILASQMLTSAESSYLLELQKNSVSRYVCFTSHTRYTGGGVGRVLTLRLFSMGVHVHPWFDSNN